MIEFIQKASQGWAAYSQIGKVSGLLLISLAFLWIYYKQEEDKRFLVYATVMTGLCIFPVTAGILMMYQTRFYDYLWIWSAVPGTALIAWALVVFTRQYIREQSSGKPLKAVVLYVVVFLLLFVSGSMGRTLDDDDNPVDYGAERTDNSWIRELLCEIKEASGEDHICLWAPAEVMEYVRETDASINLIYGRNMWTPGLNAYTFDTYSEDLVEMYRWMEGDTEELDSGKTADQGSADLTGGKEENASMSETVGKYCEKALESGVNCVLLPAQADENVVRQFETVFGNEAMDLGDYYLITTT